MAFLRVAICSGVALGPYFPTRMGMPNTSANAHQSRTVKLFSIYITAHRRVRPLRQMLPLLVRGRWMMNL
ncbi:hypothetical protein D3C80_2011080 [compost metagenome]